MSDPKWSSAADRAEVAILSARIEYLMRPHNPFDSDYRLGDSNHVQSVQATFECVNRVRADFDGKRS